MSSLTYALVTPCYAPDRNRCSMLVESIERWVAPHVKHYLIIDRRDEELFKPFTSSRTTMLTVENVLPPWLFRLPGIPKVWFSLRSLPVRNWILQQIVKLSIASVVPEDVLLCTDSDVFFISAFEPRDLERGGKVPLFVETGLRGMIPNNDRWHQSAAELLGLPAEATFDTNYIGNVIPWRRQNVLELQRRLESRTAKPWQQALAAKLAFAEYVLYGMFVQKVLREASGHWNDPVVRTLCYWGTTPLDQEGLERLKSTRQPHHHTVMISAKSRTPVESIRRAFW